MTNPHDRKISIKASLSNYFRCIREPRLSRWASEWIQGFMDEVTRSRVNQVSLVLGAIGISGVVAASFFHLVDHPGVLLFAALGGISIFIAITAYYCAKKRRMEQPRMEHPADKNYSEKHLIELLWLLQKQEQAMLASEIATQLEITKEETDQLLISALSDEWIEQIGGTFFRMPEGMKASARRRIKNQQQEAHDA
uniref:Uncharacterized protein n=1 Tax=Candidatus Kentrum sp. DK TaxID=2126562 RepID=A0A450T2T6_9GAMM|nr:MAG: hypothetical protein BECKDK2373B_GA0170837_10965 [Candidatus Kentron sp. DK]